MTRIILLGCAGSGKTTLARALGARTGTPVICLDDIWQRHWGPDDVDGFRETLKKAHAGESWISDGNFAAATFDIRLPRADLVVWLDRSRWVCAWRAILRVFRRGEAHRPKDLMRVLRFIWGFKQRNRPLIELTRIQHAPGIAVVRLANDRQIAAFLATAGAAANGTLHAHRR